MAEGGEEDPGQGPTGIDFGEFYPDQVTTVSAACRQDRHQELRRMLRGRNCAPRSADSAGRQAIHHAAQTGSFICLNILLDLDPSEKDSTTHDGSTPLLLACRGLKSRRLEPTLEERELADRCQRCVHALLERGADTNVANNDLDTPLQWAARATNPQVVKWLMRSGAELERADMDGLTPLHNAVNRAQFEVDDVLTDFEGEEEEEDMVTVVAYMLRHCRDAILYAEDNHGMYPVDLAVEYKKLQCAEMMFDAAEDKERLAKVRKFINFRADSDLLARILDHLTLPVSALSLCEKTLKMSDPNSKYMHRRKLRIAMAGKSETHRVMFYKLLPLTTAIVEVGKEGENWQNHHPLKVAIDEGMLEYAEAILRSGLPISKARRFPRTGCCKYASIYFLPTGVFLPNCPYSHGSVVCSRVLDDDDEISLKMLRLLSSMQVDIGPLGDDCQSPLMLYACRKCRRDHAEERSTERDIFRVFSCAGVRIRKLDVDHVWAYGIVTKIVFCIQEGVLLPEDMLEPHEAGGLLPEYLHVHASAPKLLILSLYLPDRKDFIGASLEAIKSSSLQRGRVPNFAETEVVRLLERELGRMRSLGRLSAAAVRRAMLRAGRFPTRYNAEALGVPAPAMDSILLKDVVIPLSVYESCESQGFQDIC